MYKLTNKEILAKMKEDKMIEERKKLKELFKKRNDNFYEDQVFRGQLINFYSNVFFYTVIFSVVFLFLKTLFF